LVPWRRGLVVLSPLFSEVMRSTPARMLGVGFIEEKAKWREQCHFIQGPTL
jgi:hypothetical protein